MTVPKWSVGNVTEALEDAREEACIEESRACQNQN